MNSGIGVPLVRHRDLSLNAKIFLFVIASTVVLNITPLSVLAPWLIFLFGIALGILLISIFAPEDFRFVFKNLFLIGFGLRILFSVSFYVFSFVLKGNYSPGFIFPNDGWCYSVQGWQICKFAERGVKITVQTFMSDPNMKDSILSGNITPYDFFASHFYSVVGYSPLSLFFISSLVGSIAALFIYFIAKELFSKNVARVSGFLAFFWPSFILWSTQNIKEPMMAMLICILLWTIFYMRRHPFPGFLLLSIAVLWVLYKISFVFTALVVSMIIFAGLILFANHLFKNKFIVILIISLSLLLFILLLKEKVILWMFEKSVYKIENYKSIFDFLNYHRGARAYGSLQFFKNVDISSFGKIMSFVPLGLFYAIFAPFPWQLGSMAQVMAVPETIIFYVLVPFTVKGIIFAYRKRFTQSILLFSIIAATLLSLALVEGNVGTMFRHRCVAFYLLFIFTGVGISLKRRGIEMSLKND